MTDQILHQRAVHRRSAKARRQGPENVVTPAAPAAAAGDAADKGPKAAATTTTTTNAASQPAVPTTTTSVTTSSTTTSSETTSSSTSTKPIKVAPVTTPSTTTPVLPSTTQTKPSRAPVTLTSFVTQHSSSPAASASASPSSTGSTSTGSIVGSIAGGVVVLVVVIAIAGFFIRRWRKRAAERDEFSPDRFRRSAVLLDDANDEPSFKPRPPSMIERRTAQSPAAPPSAYPYSDADSPTQYGSDQRNFHNYGAVPGQNGQYNGSPGPYGAPNLFGAPPIPHNGQQYPSSNQGYGPGAAPYGAYGAPDVRYLQRQPSQGPHFPQYPGPAQQSAFGPGQIMPPQNIRTPSPHELNDSLPNPFASATAIEHSTSTTSSRSAGSPPPGNPGEQGAYLTRQPTQNGGAPPAYMDDGSYTEMRRDVKVAPLMVANVDDSAAPSSSSSPMMTTSAIPEAAPAASRRPLSTHTMYDADDAYGGI